MRLSGHSIRLQSGKAWSVLTPGSLNTVNGEVDEIRVSPTPSDAGFCRYLLLPQEFAQIILRTGIDPVSDIQIEPAKREINGGKCGV